MQLPALGDLIRSRYRLERVLGEGGFARVYEGRDVEIDRLVAIKVLKPSGGEYPEAKVARFAREVRVIASLSDAHIVTLFDHGRTHGGLMYMIFEHVAGRDLAELILEGPFDGAATVHVLRQLLRALRVAHAADVLHRDIKPENIRVFEHGGDPLMTKLLDFGVAKLLDPAAQTLTQTGKTVGTLNYMSPEQLTGKELTPASDIYCLGLVAWEMLTGERSQQILHLRTGQQLRLPSRLGVEPALREVVDRMLSRHPEERFQTAVEVLEALKRVDVTNEVDVIDLEEPPREPEVLPVADTESPAVPSGSLRLVGATLVSTLAILGVLIVRAETAPPERVRVIPTAPLREAEWLKIGEKNAAPLPNHAAPTHGVAEPTSVPALDGCGASPPFRGLGQLVSDESDRRIVAYVPRSYAPRSRSAIVLMFHENGEPPDEFVKYSKLPALAEREGFIVLAPEDPTPDMQPLLVAEYWADRADLSSVREALRSADKQLCVDPKRVYAIGHGAGGRAVEQLPCEMEVTAIATTSFRSRPTDRLCMPANPVPYMIIAPLKDGYNPVDGGMSCSNAKEKISLKEKERQWRARNGCKSGPRKEALTQGNSVCYQWVCDVPLVSCHLDSGRNWPGTPKRAWDYRNCDGPPTTFPVPETIWEFFELVTP